MEQLQKVYKKIESLQVNHLLLDDEFLNFSVKTNEPQDLDIIFFNIDEVELLEKLKTLGFVLKERQTMILKKGKGIVRLDFYIDWINCGYYYLFPVVQSSSECVYIAYQVLEPIVKFGKYKQRHIHRIKRYLDKFGGFSNNTTDLLSIAIGKTLTKKILKQLLNNNYNISSTKVKWSLAFRNGNFNRILKERIL